LVTKVPAHNLYRRTDFLLRLMLRVVEIVLMSRNAANNQGVFVSFQTIYFQLAIAFSLRDDFPAFLPRPAIKDDINFFLDFDFQPLYTFINCGFLLRTAHP